METHLFKRGKNNEVRTIIVKTYSDKFEVWYGVLNGKLQVETTYPKCKNIGKINETSITQQVILESNSIINKKIKSGYSTSLDAPSEVTLPAKVKVYQDNLKNIKFPAYSTPKLNGVNGLFKRENSKLTLYSRGGEIYPDIPHLIKPITDLMDNLNCNELNGELYIHGQHLQDIQSAVKKPNHLSYRLGFYIFDIPDIKSEYAVRNQVILKDIANTLTLLGSPIRLHIGFLIGEECYSHEDIELKFNAAIQSGYEGTVIYNANHVYKYNERSSDAFKYKKALDAEFQIIDYELDKQGNPTLICQSEGGPFKVRPTGTAEYRKQLLVDLPNHIGKFYKVEYETLSRDKIPLKPIGVGIRDCDLQGNPVI